MRRYDEQVDVRRGLVGAGRSAQSDRSNRSDQSDQEEGPCEFLWRGRLWVVRAVVSHWVETGPWWTSPGVRAVIGAEGSSQEAIEQVGGSGSRAGAGGVATLDDLLAESEVWRVEAHVPRRPGRPPLSLGETGFGVFDLVFSWTTGCWRLTGSLD